MSNEFLNQPPRSQRTSLLLGPENLQKLAAARVLILGLGGVGAFAAEALARAGVGELVLIDSDNVEESNCNRQLIALTSTLGKPKAQVLAERIYDINPAVKVTPLIQYLEDTNMDELLATKFDFAVDAIDSLTPKVNFIIKCRAAKIATVSALGAGGKLDPSQIRLADISKTYGCNLGRAVRKKLRDLGVYKGVMTVFSPEIADPEAIYTYPKELKNHRSMAGTVSYMPAMFGLYCASCVIRKLTGKL